MNQRRLRYSYTICDSYDSDIFSRQCAALEKHIPNIELATDLVDVDGTEIKQYVIDGKMLMIKNDYPVDAVYIDSDIEIGQFFSQS